MTTNTEHRRRETDKVDNATEQYRLKKALEDSSIKGCGKSECFGQGNYAECGKPHYMGMHYCGECKLKVANARIAELEELTKWNKFSDAPKDGSRILIRGGTYGSEIGCEFHGSKNKEVLIVSYDEPFDWFMDGDLYYVHFEWQHLPPAEKKGEPTACRICHGSLDKHGRCIDPECIPY